MASIGPWTGLIKINQSKFGKEKQKSTYSPILGIGTKVDFSRSGKKIRSYDDDTPSRSPDE